ncbi:MurR/RpiR family transcriptional regulator [Methylobacterium sp. SyP6R]|uniref:MurR/RpiR family transcriptional regulator n=1 Tax=Methylobacterium sp. SyP6R TaxID=2718876 RepID=UPI001F236AD8|nr:MurR/RpiR family transcriptional regulator [Methylobacterium sp. SyP6R]MCF4127252.1 MurR/RpiR family transcriptional regulator [Methylobacterium sp. SyP6R]
MSGPPDGASVAQRIARSFPALSQSHREVARYVLDHPLKAATLPVAELAELVGVSVATANRFARALGYEGYAQFRAALVLGFEGALAPVEKLRGDLEQPADPASVFDATFAAIGRNLEATRSSLDAGACARAVAAIQAARRVYIVGFGSSSWPAGLLARNLDLTRQDVHLLATVEGPAFAARAMRRLTADDLVIVLATPRYFTDTVRLATQGRESGATVLALTDGPHSPIAAQATITLCVRTDSRYFAASDASLAALVEALSSAVAHASGSLVAAATRLTESVLPWLDGDYAAWPIRGSAVPSPDPDPEP